jgi:hypothetical protein
VALGGACAQIEADRSKMKRMESHMATAKAREIEKLWTSGAVPQLAARVGQRT